jgi:hypothetical protein
MDHLGAAASKLITSLSGPRPVHNRGFASIVEDWRW